MRSKIIRVIIPVVILSIGIFYYYTPPAETIWVPKCPWWMLTGTYCPSCGIQRFLHELMISLPYATLAILGKWYNINGKLDDLNRFIYSRKVLIAYLTLYLIWWAIRIIFKI